MRVRTCIFCGGGPLTDEHVFATQLYRLLPPDASARFGEVTVEPDGSSSRAVLRPSDPRGPVVAHAVCRKGGRGCNDTWMAAIDSATKPVLSRLNAGRRDPLTEPEALVLSTWAAKLAFTLEALPHVRTMVFSQAARRAFRDDRTPPSGWRVWLATCGGRHTTTYGTQPVRVRRTPAGPPEIVGRLTTLGLGTVVLQAFGPRVEGAEVAPLVGSPEGAVQIWPGGRGVELPEAGVLNDGTIRGFADFRRWPRRFT